MLYITFLSFIFGASLGSFANVVADRLRVRPILKSRSMCLSCGKHLTWKELFPIFSFLYQKGKCKNCKSKIPMTCLITEIITGSLVAALPFVISNMIDIYKSPIYFYYSLFLFFSIAIVITVCASIAIYDMRHMLVPYELVSILFFVGVISIIFRNYIFGFNIYDVFAGLIVAAPYMLLYIFSRGKWVGLGDVLLYVSLGGILGLTLGVSMFLFSVWIGAFTAIMLIIFHRKDYGLKSEIPFTPFIILAAAVVFYFNIDILGINDMFY